MNAYELAGRLRQALEVPSSDGLHLDPKASFRTWTPEFCRFLESLGRGDYVAYYPGNEGYLLDFIWYRMSSHQIELAAEIEWTREDDRLESVSYDFEKLMHIKCPLKLLVYQVGNDPTAGGDLLKKLESKLQVFGRHSLGDEYLLMEFSNPWTTAAFWHLSVKRDGRQQERLHFNLLSPVASQ